MDAGQAYGIGTRHLCRSLSQTLGHPPRYPCQIFSLNMQAYWAKARPPSQPNSSFEALVALAMLMTTEVPNVPGTTALNP
jgi:hypothetical protein